MNNNFEKRSKIIEELISTEAAYLNHLNLILKFFVDPLQCSRSLITHKDISTIFGDIRSIRLVNQVLYDHLDTFGVNTAFSQLVQFLKLYSGYARNFSSSQILLTRLIRTNKEFKSFLEQQENLPVLKGLKLPALLITPIQRIPRYKLLLEELIAATDEETDDKRELECILRQLKEVADQINNCIEDFDNCSRIIAVQRSLDGCSPKLLVPGRKLLKTGKLTKVSKNGVKQQSRSFWLFTDVLLYAKNNPRKVNCYLFSGVFPLRHCYVERIIGKNMFSIRCKNETLTLLAREYRILDDWVNALESAIKNLSEARRTLRKESSSSNPLRRGVLKNCRQHSSLSEKLQVRLKQQKAAIKQNDKLPAENDRFLKTVRKRVLKFFRKRSNSEFVSIENSLQTNIVRSKNRRILARSPILSMVEEEESKRASLTESFSGGIEESSFSDVQTPLRKRPWWEEDPEVCSKKVTDITDKKFRCCAL